MEKPKSADKKTPIRVEKTGREIDVRDVAIDDKRIPPNLILKYGDDYYVMKAGLEWKANAMFGGAGYSINLKPELMNHEEKHYIFKATLVVLENGSIFTNYGEAHPGNANSMLQNNLLHLAATRAECRVLRMATACGYASYDEVKTVNGDQPTPLIEDGDKPATKAQLATLEALDRDCVYADATNLTKQEAAEAIKSLSTKTAKKGK